MNVTQKFRIFRECGRDLWNLYLRDSQREEYLSRLCWQFDKILRELFQIILLDPCEVSCEVEYVKGGLEDFPEIFCVEIPNLNSDSIYISRERGHCGYWDFDLKGVSLEGIELVFIDFFDFEQIEWREFQYLRVNIVGFPAAPECIGRQALIPFVDAVIYLNNQ